MTEKNLLMNAGAVEKKNPGRTLVGKIARIPNEIREQLNRRMRDGEVTATILRWLNDLPEVKSILAEQFGGTAISPQNVSTWRRNGYQRWLQTQEPFKGIAALAEESGAFSRAGNGNLANGAAALAAARLLDYMRRVPPDQCSAGEMAQISFAAMTLLKGEQANAQLKLAERRIVQKDEQLLLTRDRDQRNTITIGLRLLGDARAKEIEGSSHSYAEKIEMLGLHTFGEELWQARFVPEASNSAGNDPS